MHESPLPVGATSIRLLKRRSVYPFQGGETFTRSGKDGNEIISPICGGDEYIGEVLEGWWKKWWDTNINASTPFRAFILDGVLELEGDADAAGTWGYGGIDGQHPIPLLDELEVMVELESPTADTGASVDRDIVIRFFLTKDKIVTQPNSENDYLKIEINVDEDGLLLRLYKRIGGAAESLLFDGSDYDGNNGRSDTADPITIWRLVFHDSHEDTAYRHLHVYLKQGPTREDCEGATEYELTDSGDGQESPYDISDLLFKIGYPAYEIGTQHATYFDDGDEAMSDYLRVDYPNFDLRYELAEADLHKGDVEIWDTMGSASEADWQQVFDEDHVFTGEAVLQNGLIRLHIDEGTLYGFRMYYWTGAAWSVQQGSDGAFSDCGVQHLNYCFLEKIEKISPEKTVIEFSLRDTAVKDDNYFLTMECAMERGKHTLEINFIKAYPKQVGIKIYWGGWPSIIRFGYAGDAETEGIGDDDLSLTAVNDTLTDDFGVLFDDAGPNVLAGMGLKQKDIIGTTIYLSLIPFALFANLFVEAEDEPRGAATLVTDAAASPLAGANNAVQLNAIGDFQVPNGEYSAYTFTAGTDLPEGRYLAVIRARYVDVETMEMYVWQDDDNEYRNKENDKVTKTLAATFGYHSVVFDITAADVAGTKDFAVVAEKTTSDTDEIRVDYHLIVPIGDGESWPQDQAHSAMRGDLQERRLYSR